MAHQRNLRDRDDASAMAELRKRWFNEICGSDKDVAFFVGNQAKRAHVFSILGVYYPKLTG